MKDEEMAEEWVKENMDCCKTDNSVNQSIPYFSEEERCVAKSAFLAGLKAGRPQWHKVADGDLPEVDNRIVLCVCGNGYIDGKEHYILKLLTRKEFPLFQPVIKWCEIPTFDKE